ncbi:hypothetical protein MASR2M15_21320 [Anaerolineales bacterium]
MPYQIDWIVPKQVLHIYMWGDFSIEDVENLNKDHIALLEQGDASCHSILDIHNIGHFPTNIVKLVQTQGVYKDAAPGWFILIGANAVVRFLIKATGQLSHLNAVAVENFERASYTLQSKFPDLSQEKWEQPIRQKV